MKASTFLSKKNKRKIAVSIKKAELKSSGEIRVHLENHCNGSPFNRALEVFKYLKMEETDARNGVLIYLAVRDKQFAIVGDEGINNVVPNNFWDHIKEIMETHFKNNEFTKGIELAVHEIGKQLSAYFPYESDDINELSNEISWYDN
jgi:uncharacterized membrane protein